jgi:flagellar secretion chaperone FliS
MASPNHDRYLEAEVLNADPLKLVLMLYRAAIEAVAAARRHLQQGDIRERSGSITRAMEIVNELALSLNHVAGGDISRNLAELYAYVQTRLIEANTQQTEPPLAEVEALLSTLLEAWCSPAPNTAVDSHKPEYAPVSCTY